MVPYNTICYNITLKILCFTDARFIFQNHINHEIIGSHVIVFMKINYTSAVITKRISWWSWNCLHTTGSRYLDYWNVNWWRKIQLKNDSILTSCKRVHIETYTTAIKPFEPNVSSILRWLQHVLSRQQVSSAPTKGVFKAPSNQTTCMLYVHLVYVLDYLDN